MTANNNQKYMEAFEELKRGINKLAGNTRSYSFEIDRAADNDIRVRNMRHHFENFRDIRNCLGHPEENEGVPPFIITDEFLAKISRFAQEVKRKPKASELGIPRKQVYAADLGSNVMDIAEQMRARHFSHIPILDNRHVVQGVFNEAAVFDFLVKAGIAEITPETRIKDILEYCKISNTRTERFSFVKPGTRLETIAKAFTKSRKAETRLGVMFVTASGSPRDPLQRMITAWDALEHYARVLR